MARSSDGRSSLRRAVQLIEAFEVGVRDLSLSEIANRSGIPVSSAHRLIAELVSLGLLERLDNRRYRIGLRLWELAVRTPGALGIREIALPFMRHVQDLVQHHTQLSVLQGDSVLYLDVLSAPDSVVNLTVVGGRLPYYAASSGLVLVAFADAETRDQMLAAPIRPHHSAPTPSDDEMRATLRRVRAQGFAVTRGYIRKEATAIAVPILDPLGNALAALAVVVPFEARAEQQSIEILRAATAQIESAVRRHYTGRS